MRPLSRASTGGEVESGRCTRSSTGCSQLGFVSPGEGAAPGWSPKLCSSEMREAVVSSSPRFPGYRPSNKSDEKNLSRALSSSVETASESGVCADSWGTSNVKASQRSFIWSKVEVPQYDSGTASAQAPRYHSVRS